MTSSPSLQLTLDWRGAADPAPEAQQEQVTQVLAVGLDLEQALLHAKHFCIT